VPGIPNCPYCKGLGYTLKDDDTQDECLCFVALRMKAHLGPEILATPNVTPAECVFYKEERFLTDTNLLIKTHWPDMLPHLKLALIAQGTRYKFKITTDEALKVVYVGAESYASKSKSKRDDLETYNSLGDLIGQGVNLAIVRLGFLGYKNVAMPGILKEALMIRKSLNLPTWLIEDPNVPFTEGHRSWSMEVHTYILESFRVIEINSPNSPVASPTPVPRARRSKDVALDDPSWSEPQPQTRAQASVARTSSYQAKKEDKHAVDFDAFLSDRPKKRGRS
jgi:hypothetical protein